MTKALAFLFVLALFVYNSVGQTAETGIILASTTSTENSGLFSHILPLF